MIEFKNLAKKRIRQGIFKKLYKKIFIKKRIDLSVVFAPPLFMAKLNRKYRHKNKPANVLSFLLSKKDGEIFLNVKEKKLLYLFAHGSLHLLGYGHKTKSEAEIMRKKEEAILKP